MEKSARMLALSTFAFATGILLSMAVVLNMPDDPYAQSAAVATSTTTGVSNTACSAPGFFSISVPVAYLNAPWSLPLLSAIETQDAPVVTAQNLAPGLQLKDEKTTLAAGGAVLHTWYVTGAPSQVGTYSMTIVAQNSCGGASTVITLPVNNATNALGQVCPQGTTGTYPNCIVLAPTSTSASVQPAATPAVTMPQSPIVPAQPQLCAQIQGTLRQGSRGADVVALQQFLIQKGLLPSDSATGYFGALTRGAVQQFQASAGIVSSGTEDTTGFGLVGARTRLALSAGCEQTSSASTPAPSSAPPTDTGAIHNYSAPIVPLTGLPQCPRVIAPACPGGNLISMGTDENHCVRGYICSTTSNALCSNIATPSCPNNGQAVPTSYDANGCANGYACQQLVCPSVQQPTCAAGQHIVTAPDPVTGCASISYCVGGTSQNGTTNTTNTSTGTFSATPSAGNAPLAVFFTGPVADSGSYAVEFGDGANSGSLSGSCASTSSCTVSTSHTYTTPGVYSAMLVPYVSCRYASPGCMLEVQSVGTAIVVVTGASANTNPSSGSIYDYNSVLQQLNNLFPGLL